MSIEERQALLDKANELALDFPSNVKTEKLKAMIAEAEGPAAKPDTDEQETPEKTGMSAAKIEQRRRIKEAKDRALKLSVVTITNKDPRENDIMTTTYLSFENQYFGVSRDVPLDVPVQIEQALIDIAESTTMTLHKDEILDGKRTGNKVPVTVKKFAVSYAKQQPE